MRVEELIIDGFKLYATRTVISGWDSSFNAITGLNGLGKSNILDAICFVLGIALMTVVRAQNLQDLIYKRGQAGVTKASVTIVFDNLEVLKLPIGFELHPRISVTRQIVLGGTSKYLINGHRAQQQTVLQLFQLVQLNINNPNFLIMQGKITKVLNMKPLEILSLIEEAAGTKMYESMKDKAQKTMAKKETKLQGIRTDLGEEIEPKLEKLRQEKRTFLEFQQTQSDLERLERLVAAHDFYHGNVHYDKAAGELEASEQQMRHLGNTIDRTKLEIAILKEDLEQVARTVAQTGDGVLAELEKRELLLSNEQTRLKTQMGLSQGNCQEERQRLQQLGQQQEQLSQRQRRLDLTLARSVESSYQEAKERLQELKQKHAAQDALISSLSTGVSRTDGGDDSSGYAAQLQHAKEQLSLAQVQQQQHQLKIEHLEQEIAADEPRVHAADDEYRQLQDKLELQRGVVQQLQQQLQQLGFDPEKHRQLELQERQLSELLNKLVQEAEGVKQRVSSLDFQYTRPLLLFDPLSVKGLAAQLFTIDENRYDLATALEVCAGGRLYNVVVDTEATGLQLLERGQLRKRVTIIPLNKILAHTLSQKVVGLAKELCPGKVELALDLVGYDDEVQRAMEYIFGLALVCADAESAKKVTFHKQIQARLITLQGDVYDPRGTLSGGLRRGGQLLLVTIQRYNRLQKEIAEAQQQVDRLREQVGSQQQLNQQTTKLQQQLGMAEHQLKLLKRQAELNPSLVIVTRQQLRRAEIEKLREMIQEQGEAAKRFEQEARQVEKNMKEFSSNKGGKLKQLEQELQQMGRAVLEAEAAVRDRESAFQQARVERELLAQEEEEVKDLVAAARQQLVQMELEMASLQERAQATATELAEVRRQLEEERAQLLGISEQMKELTRVLEQKTQQLLESQLERQKLAHLVEKLESTAAALKQRVSALKEQHPWLDDDKVVSKELSANPSINLEDCRHRIGLLQERFQGMKRKVNPNIMSMIDVYEKKESELQGMVKTIERDKRKIEETVATLNEHKKQALVKTWRKVLEDFGQIFSDLLPGLFAKLVVPEGMDVTQGLEVKVKLGAVWKESLVELLGGQRLLIALLLIMALLQFKPAPMYILDEVDAALDLSHTQNIGHLIKTRFKGLQFIVVLLKEGMFTNANRVFRTRFQDGTSVVSVM